MQPAPLLRGALLANAVFSVATALILTAWSGPLADAMGLPAMMGLAPSWWLLALAPGLLVFAVLLILQARSRRVRVLAALATSLADLGWVLASVGVMVLGWNTLTPTGLGLVAGVAGVVALLGTAQVLGVARLHRSDGARGDYRYTLHSARHMDVPAAVVWPLVADVDAYHEVAPNLTASRVLSGSGVGTVRACSDKEGRSWTEQAVVWEDGHRYAFRVHTEAPDYGYPFTALRGEWSVEPQGESCIVRMRFDATAPGGLLTDLVLALGVERRFGPAMETILDGWQARAAAASSVTERRAIGRS